MTILPETEKIIQEALRISELRYRRLFETAQDGILILDAATGMINDANPFLLEMLEYSLEEILGKQLWEIGFFKDRMLAHEAFDKLQKEGYIRYENLPLETKTGQARAVEFVSNLYIVDREKVIQCNIRDITDRKLLEAKFQQAQKMQAIGQLAGGVAHDFNNILTSSLLRISLLLDDPDLVSDIRNSLRQLENDSKRAAGLTRQLLLFSRQHLVELKPLDLNTVLVNLLNMLSRLLGKEIDLDYQMENKPLWINADNGMIEQVVTNLCLNARDAMAPKGGKLTIDVRSVQLESGASQVNPEACAGLFACLTVSDTGCGMDAMTLSHLFEPFFTTKEVGKGTGLGLSTVYGITKRHNGWVEVDSQLGRGSTFRVYLPASIKVPILTSEIPGSVIIGGKESILLVEDDTTVRTMVSLGLQQQGYHVFEASNGPEAIKVWGQHAGEIDLLFTDMRMPAGMTGLELFILLKQTRADLQGVISSGFSDDITKTNEKSAAGLRFLPKPYDVQTLASTVRSSLDDGKSMHISNPPAAASP